MVEKWEGDPASSDDWGFQLWQLGSLGLAKMRNTEAGARLLGKMMLHWSQPEDVSWKCLGGSWTHGKHKNGAGLHLVTRNSNWRTISLKMVFEAMRMNEIPQCFSPGPVLRLWPCGPMCILFFRSLSRENTDFLERRDYVSQFLYNLLYTKDFLLYTLKIAEFNKQEGFICQILNILQHITLISSWFWIFFTYLEVKCIL